MGGWSRDRCQRLAAGSAAEGTGQGQAGHQAGRARRQPLAAEDADAHSVADRVRHDRHEGTRRGARHDGMGRLVRIKNEPLTGWSDGAF